MSQTRRRILVIDDDPEILHLVRLLLERIDIEAITVASAKEAAQSLRAANLPDLIILDLMLPQVSGLEFLRQLRSKAMFNDLPVLVLSALVEANTIREALELGADRYLTKPYIGNNLIPTVQEMLRTGRRAKNS